MSGHFANGWSWEANIGGRVPEFGLAHQKTQSRLQEPSERRSWWLYTSEEQELLETYGAFDRIVELLVDSTETYL